MSRSIRLIGGTRNGATSRPYRPTNLTPAARDRDRLSLIDALFVATLLLAALYLGVR